MRTLLRACLTLGLLGALSLLYAYELQTAKEIAATEITLDTVAAQRDDYFARWQACEGTPYPER